MCSLLLTSMAVPFGYVNYEPSNEYPNWSLALHRLYTRMNIHYFVCNCVENHHHYHHHHLPAGETSVSASSSFSPPSPLPDLVMSHNPQSSPRVNATRCAEKSRLDGSHHHFIRHGALVARAPSSSSSSSSKSENAAARTTERVVDMNRRKDNALPCSLEQQQQQQQQRTVEHNLQQTVYGEGVRHILEVRHRFPRQIQSYIGYRREYTLSWDEPEAAYYSLFNTYCNYSSPPGFANVLRSSDEDCRRVGRQLRRLADDFDLCYRKNEKTFALKTNLGPLQKFVTHCFLFSFIGVFVYKVFFKK